jgi:hypothetical protein
MLLSIFAKVDALPVSEFSFTGYSVFIDFVIVDQVHKRRKISPLATANAVNILKGWASLNGVVGVC